MASLTQEGKKDESSVSFVGSVPDFEMSFEDVENNLGPDNASIKPLEDSSLETDNAYEVILSGEVLGYGVQLEVLNFEAGMTIEYGNINGVDISTSDNKINLKSNASYVPGDYTSIVKIKNGETVVAAGLIHILKPEEN